VAPETTIKQLFHYRAPENDLSRATFSSFTLAMFFIPYQLVFSVMIGSAVPGGVFIPSMIAGASLGRVIGHLLRSINGAELLFADKGTYALVGAAATLSGLTRLTIAATVMLLEATGTMQYVSSPSSFSPSVSLYMSLFLLYVYL
jgi:chloride channel 7